MGRRKASAVSAASKMVQLMAAIRSHVQRIIDADLPHQEVMHDKTDKTKHQRGIDRLTAFWALVVLMLPVC